MNEKRNTIEEMIRNAKPESFPWRGKNHPTVTLFFPELTWKCPRQAYPDFGKLSVSYVPCQKILEMKSFKLYLNSFRDRYIGQERVPDEIFEALWELLNPHVIKLDLKVSPRGNMKNHIKIERRRKCESIHP